MTNNLFLSLSHFIIRSHTVAAFSLIFILVGLISHSLGFKSAETIVLNSGVLSAGVIIIFSSVHKAFKREGGADFLAIIAIGTAFITGELYAAAVLIFMLSGGKALEEYALHRASRVLDALAARLPNSARRRKVEPENTSIEEVLCDDIEIGDEIEILPHSIVPVDGLVVEGTGWMDESFLTGEPYRVEKTGGTAVISGAVNGDIALVVKATAKAIDSRYAQIAKVLTASKQLQPKMRRIGDVLGGWYAPFALTVAIGAWLFSGESSRFLSVLVVATPCPLLIAIPVAIIGSISLAARRGIIITDPMVLERSTQCRTAIFDKTGTLTEGSPVLSNVVLLKSDISEEDVFTYSASAERYSTHPLAQPLLRATQERGISFVPAVKVEERPGEGLVAEVQGKSIKLSGRKHLTAQQRSNLPMSIGGLETVLVIDDEPAAIFHFYDQPRLDAKKFINHLKIYHNIKRVIILSGDRPEEAQRIGALLGLTEVRADLSPEEKVHYVVSESAKAPTLFVGDGINDAPALSVAHVGIALGKSNSIASQAAGAVILEPSLSSLDELLHIGISMRSVALQSALGGMALSMIAMSGAVCGLINPIMGALIQEAIDLLAVMNALRTSSAGKISDFN